ncbi:MAG: sulfatase-like hydrolase/transferase [Nitrospiraceae bacterium]|nr:sulfatase-like hydrolase/transferase [Nitrospiraceae bacterium]
MNTNSTRLGKAGAWAAIGSVLAAGVLPCGAAAQEVLPAPPHAFKGQIGLSVKDSKPDFPRPVQAPKGAPNIVLILLDDVGFGASSTFGGPVDTPTLDRLAKNGLRYTQFHTTALSSPTRAALLTGRNHHSVGTGVITEIGAAYPGYSGQIPKSAAMISEILRQNGYSTAFFGKNHNVPDWETSVSGPFDRWPGLQGFEHFYGFIGGEANQWAPALYRDNHRVEMKIPKGKEGHYTLNDSLADEAIKYIFQQKSVTPDRPFFVYYAPGATHAPHHVPKEWMDKFKGQFDQGWDKYREETYQRQLKLGVIPPGTELTPKPKAIPAYDSLTPDRKRVAARLMEAFAGYTVQTDYEIGRQYFEMFGNRAIYKDGWIACARHGRLPWTLGTYDFNTDKWELYYLPADFSEDNNLAAKYPGKLKELQDFFWVEAEKYQVLPLDDRLAERSDPTMRPSLIEGRTKFTYYPGNEQVPEGSAPPIMNRSHTITAYVDIPREGADGVLVAEGGVVGGYVLYIKDGRPTYEYNYITQTRYKVTSSEVLSPGPNVIRMEFHYDGGGLGTGDRSRALYPQGPDTEMGPRGQLARGGEDQPGRFHGRRAETEKARNVERGPH